MSHSQMLGKVESGGGPIFKVVLECLKRYEAMGKCRLWVNVALGPMRHLPMMGICRP